MKFSYSWLKEIAKFKESPEAIAEFLTLRVFEVESVTPSRKKGRNEDWALDVTLIPNRVADASGHLGLAREIATLGGKILKLHPIKVLEDPRERAEKALRVSVEKPADTLRYTARIIRGVTVKLSPDWLRERLETCGIQSINNVVDAANYVMLEHGQPLHIFDAAKLEGNTIIVRRARAGEKLAALDEKTYSLDPEILVIADALAPIAIAGVKGGKASGVTERTRDIVLEAANFDPVRIRAGSKHLGLTTDASYRFERGLDPNQTEVVIDRLAELIQEVAGGTALRGRIDRYPVMLRPSIIPLNPETLRRVAGAAIPNAFINQSIKRLGWSASSRANLYEVKPTTLRRDIAIEEDVIEEIVRLWGYDRIPAAMPQSAFLPAPRNEGRWWADRMRDSLVGAGYSELSIYEMVGRKFLEVFRETPDDALALENPASPETEFLIEHPAEQFLRLAGENLRHGNDVRVFGIAKGWKKLTAPSSKNPSDEKSYLTIAAASRASSGNDHGELFFSVKGAVDRLLESLGIGERWYDDELTSEERRRAAALHPYRTAKVMADNEVLGMVAELHPEVVENLKVRGRIAFAELRLAPLLARAETESEYRPVGKYPAIVRDLALIVPDKAKSTSVQEVIEHAVGPLLTDVDLFDYFQDDAMEAEGTKSLAFHLTFQSAERTLTDEGVKSLMVKIARSIESEGWEMRA